MIRRVAKHEQTDASTPVALFQLDYGPEESFFPVPDDEGAVFWGYFVNNFTFPQDETGPVTATYDVSERGAYLLNGASTNNFLPLGAIVLAVRLGGRWFISGQVYVP